ncbi:GNAT family N-acetyltransferase [Kineosporia rhizophila]|uniref:GNAT family N-acetyltransferase n=1 Tax=Kineosporia rhizophila TaxID=84633 RepID=UPI001E542455|nr:GNAT family N-acetyltransferase [Kineosporia rhizophila]MCE0539535.1 GNAT family N-acetyltransferase [Kineosporia rhizophila]
MPDLFTPRLQLHPIDVAEGERIHTRTAGPNDTWADDFPFDGDVAAAGAFLRTTTALGQQQPFGYYRITRRSDGKAVGGIGFKGQPQHGSVEIGYGLAGSARGHGYAAEAVTVLLTIAAGHGLSRVLADTDRANVASQRTLTRAGFHRVRAEGEVLFYEVQLATGR